jgi:hypothetical protein
VTRVRKQAPPTSTLRAIGIGLIVARTGYSAAFLLTAGLILPALVPALRERALGTGHDRARVAGTQE